MPPKRSSLSTHTKAARRLKLLRANLTDEQRRVRNEYQRLHAARVRALESDEQRNMRLEKNRIRRTKKREQEAQKRKRLILTEECSKAKRSHSALKDYPSVVQYNVNTHPPSRLNKDFAEILKFRFKSIIYKDINTTQQMQSHQQSVITNNCPNYLDVKFQTLPFYDVLFDLLKPSFLIPNKEEKIQESNFYFCLDEQEAIKIANLTKHQSSKKVHMRFCLLDTNCEQDDSFPLNLMVKVNNKFIRLLNPIYKNKQLKAVPLNITPLVKLNSTFINVIAVSWEAENNRKYCIKVSLVDELTPKHLLLRLKQKGEQHANVTKALLKEKLNDDDKEIATTSIRVSLTCPLSNMRIRTPCRPSTCSHVQCFDALFFLQLNKKKSSWVCPICSKPAFYDHLVIDGYFQEVLISTKLQSDINEIELHKDGTWSCQSNAADMDVPIEIKEELVE